MPEYLFINDDPEFESVSAADPNLPTMTRVAGRLYKADVDPENLGSLAGSGAPNYSMNAPVMPGDLSSVPVHLTGMDYHGTGVPIEALRRLAWRRAQENQEPIYGEGVLVGLVDCAFAHHPWLEGGYLASPNEFEPFFPAGDSNGPFTLPSFAGHATFVAGLILQQAPAAGVWVEKALGADGMAFADAVAAAATELIKRGVKILNLSLGCTAAEDGFGPVMQAMVEDLLEINPDLVIVAAAGNKRPEEPSTKFWPAALPNVVGVGSVMGDASVDGVYDERKWAEWSNRGDWVTFVTNGHQLLSTYLDRTVLQDDASSIDFDGWARWSGTSFSAAIVSGAIARKMTELSITAKAAVDILKSQAPARTTDLDIPVVRRQIWDPLLTAPAKDPSPTHETSKWRQKWQVSAS